MVPRTNKRAYQEAFRRRLASMRDSIGLTQPEMAAKLGVKPGAYAKYETRSMLPTHLIAEVCRITGHDPWFVLTGEPAHKAPGKVVSFRR